MQIYKIYINEKPLILMSQVAMSESGYGKRNTLFVRYTGQPKSIFQCIDTLEKGTIYKRVILYSGDFEQLKFDTKKLVIPVKAGGGLVINEKGEGLFIFRRGFWDLPKGKLDPGERYDEAALREVREETGVKKLLLGEKIIKTRHIFKNRKGQRILKLTNWYEMSTHKQKLTPQTGEDIEQAVWLDLDDFMENKKPVFESVWNVVDTYLKGE